METIIIHLKSKEELNAFKQMAKVLNAPFETRKDKLMKDDDDLYGDSFKKSVLKGKEAYEKGYDSQFVRVNKEDLWK